MKKIVLLLAVPMLVTAASYAETTHKHKHRRHRRHHHPSTYAGQVINCSNGFAATGSCGVFVTMNSSDAGQHWWVVGSNAGTTPAVSGSKLNLIPQGGNHVALSLMYRQAQLDVRSFTTSFSFIPNGQFFSFHANNSTNNPWGFNGRNFSAGANCENDFFQGYSQDHPPDHVFAVGFDSYSPLTQSGQFTYSGVQIYTSNPYVQCPCMPVGSGSCGSNASNDPITKISTSPVNLTTGSSNTTTGHTYMVNMVYDGNKLTLTMYDQTAGDSCPGSKCFTYSWTGVDIPASVGGDKAWVGFGGSTTSAPSLAPLYVASATYAEGAAPAPTPTPTSAPPLPTPTATATSTPTATATTTPVPPKPGNCSFTSPAGTATWQCQ